MADIALDLIDTIRVASPCSMQWDDLEGDGCVRHCRDCDLDVYNFSDMSRDEVEGLLRTKNGRLCGTFYRRADGTVMTADCPVGLRAMRRRTQRSLARIAASVGMLVTGTIALATGARSHDDGTLRSYQPFATLSKWLAPTVAPPPGPMIMGDICLPPNVTLPPPPPPVPPGPAPATPTPESPTTVGS